MLKLQLRDGEGEELDEGGVRAKGAELEPTASETVAGDPDLVTEESSLDQSQESLEQDGDQSRSMLVIKNSWSKTADQVQKKAGTHF